MRHDRPCLDCGIEKYRNRRGLCQSCYDRRRRGGRALPPSTLRTIDYYVTQLRGSPTDKCWRWPGFIGKQGYGYHASEGVYTGAHRVVYERLVGPIPEGHEIDHLCHTRDESCFDGNRCLHRACVNPTHLEVVEGAVNKQRAHRPVNEVCTRGHVMEGSNIYCPPGGGGRQCRACKQVRGSEAHRRRRPCPAPRLGTHCPSGHLLDEATLFYESSGKKRCRTCTNRRKRDRRAARKRDLASA